MKKHPAVFTDRFFSIFSKKVAGLYHVYDPFGGTGKIGLLKDHGFTGKITACEIEPEWTNPSLGVDNWIIGDAAKTDFIGSGVFNAICTSPTYGNRMADHYNAMDSSTRITYRSYLGHDLNIENTGRMQWGPKYKKKHIEIYQECKRVLCHNGLFILNISDHIRAGKTIPVVKWHQEILCVLGFELQDDIKIETPRMRFGGNFNLRVKYEHILTFIKKRG